MTTRKVDGEPIVRVFTYYPKLFKGLLSFPGIEFIEYEEDDDPFEMDYFIIRCPSEEVAHKLSHFIRAYERANSL